MKTQAPPVDFATRLTKYFQEKCRVPINFRKAGDGVWVTICDGPNQHQHVIQGGSAVELLNCVAQLLEPYRKPTARAFGKFS